MSRSGSVIFAGVLPFLIHLGHASRRWKREWLGGVARRVFHGMHPHVVDRGSRRCPDGQRPHPKVCFRGWRGDLCRGCHSSRS
ncbi:MAG: hypothetical protein HQL99_13405 [Magnetococcales bacterium]|nr:hypothetical protein [Magnetococcales bacterium]